MDITPEILIQLQSGISSTGEHAHEAMDTAEKPTMTDLQPLKDKVILCNYCGSLNYVGSAND
jgi:hypothetical protein